MDTSQGDEPNVTDQEPADDTLQAEDASLANAIAQGLSTEPVTKRQVLDALRAPIPNPPKAGPRTTAPNRSW